MIVGWEALHMKKNYDDEQENTTAYRVRLLRQDRGWSQKELADKIFVAHSQISRLESGETTNIGSSLIWSPKFFIIISRTPRTALCYWTIKTFIS